MFAQKSNFCQAQPSPVKQRLAVARSAGLRLALLSLLNHPPGDSSFKAGNSPNSENFDKQ